MEQKLRFGLVLGRMAVLKKNWADYEQLLRAVFLCFHWQFFFLNIVVSALKRYVHKTKVKKILKNS